MIDYIARIFAPFQCLGCGREEDLLICKSCRETIARVPSRCYLCKATTRNYGVCQSCKSKTPLTQVAVWTHHEDLPKELVHSAKYERAKAGLFEIADFLSDLLPYFASEVLFTHIPTATSRVRERGYDQAEVIARRLCVQKRLSYSRLLARLGQAHQVGSKRTERIAHVKNAFRPINLSKIKNAHIILIDDVCTTGASLESAARTLKQAGAKRVDAIVFSQPSTHV